MFFFDDDDEDVDVGGFFDNIFDGSADSENEAPAEEIPVNEEQTFVEDFDAENPSQETGDSWLCSCGQENAGDFCVACGRSKSEAASSSAESLSASDSWLCSCGQENVGDFCVACGRSKSEAASSSAESQPTSDSWLCSCGQENVGDFCVTCGRSRIESEISPAQNSNAEQANEHEHRRSSRSSHSFNQQSNPEPPPPQNYNPPPPQQDPPPPQVQQNQSPQQENQPSPPQTSPENAPSNGLSKAVIAGVIAGVLLLAGGGFFAFQHFKASDAPNDNFDLNDNKPAVTETTNENNLSDNTTVIGNYYIVNCQTSVTLRRTPSTTSVELAQIPLGQTVGFIEEVNNEFSKVNYNGTIGYILTQYISAQKPAPASNQNQSAPVSNQNQPAPRPAGNAADSLSLGGLHMNDDLKQMETLFGRADRNTQSKTTPNHFNAEYRDIVVTHNGQRIDGLISYSPAVKTERNIHEGSTLNEVIEAYGRRCSLQDYDGAILYEYPYETPQGLVVMRFAIKNNVVDYISLRLVTDGTEKQKILSTVKTI